MNRHNHDIARTSTTIFAAGAGLYLLLSAIVALTLVITHLALAYVDMAGTWAAYTVAALLGLGLGSAYVAGRRGVSGEVVNLVYLQAALGVIMCMGALVWASIIQPAELPPAAAAADVGNFRAMREIIIREFVPTMILFSSLALSALVAVGGLMALRKANAVTPDADAS